MWFVNIIFWLQAFLCPTILIGVAGSIIVKDISLPAFIIGAFAGIILAEYIRRQVGLDTFFGSIYGSNKLKERKRKDKA